MSKKTCKSATTFFLLKQADLGLCAQSYLSWFVLNIWKVILPSRDIWDYYWIIHDYAFFIKGDAKCFWFEQGIATHYASVFPFVEKLFYVL